MKNNNLVGNGFLITSMVGFFTILILVNTFFFTRNEGETLAKRVDSNERLIRGQYIALDAKIDKLVELIINESKK